MKCQRIVFENPVTGSPNILLGVITKETESHFVFKTARKTYTVAKTLVLSLEDTNQDFKEAAQNA